MMTMTIMGMTPDPLLRNLFVISLCVFNYSIGSVIGLGSGNFVPTGGKSKGNIFAFDMFVQTGVYSKGG